GVAAHRIARISPSKRGRGLERGGPLSARSNETAGGLGQVLMPLEHLDEMVDVLPAMSGIQLNTKTGGLDRHGRKPDGIDMNPFLANCAGELLGLGLVAEPAR